MGICCSSSPGSANPTRCTLHHLSFASPVTRCIASRCSCESLVPMNHTASLRLGVSEIVEGTATALCILGHVLKELPEAVGTGWPLGTAECGVCIGCEPAPEVGPSLWALIDSLPTVPPGVVGRGWADP